MNAFRFILYFVAFVSSLWLLGIGALWLIDNKSTVVLLQEKNKSSIAQLSQENTASREVTLPAQTNEAAQEAANKKVIETIADDGIDTDVEIAVLNGSGMAGVAGKMAELLVKNGFVNAEPGNAQGSTYQDVVIYYSNSLVSAEKIREVLSREYTSVTVEQAITGEQKISPVVVIIGK